MVTKAFIPWSFAGVGVVTVIFLVACGDCIPSASKFQCPATDNPYEPVFFPADTCSKFFRCLNGSPVIQYCPEGLDWSPSRNQCDYPWVAGCREVEAPELSSEISGICPPNQPPACFLSDKAVVEYHPHPSDCHWYYVCSHGEAHCIECGDGLYYNPATERCDKVGMDMCLSTTVAPTTVPTTTTPKPTTTTQEPTTTTQEPTTTTQEPTTTTQEPTTTTQEPTTTTQEPTTTTQEPTTTTQEPTTTTQEPTTTTQEPTTTTQEPTTTTQEPTTTTQEPTTTTQEPTTTTQEPTTTTQEPTTTTQETTTTTLEPTTTTQEPTTTTQEPTTTTQEPTTTTQEPTTTTQEPTTTTQEPTTTTQEPTTTTPEPTTTTQEPTTTTQEPTTTTEEPTTTTEEPTTTTQEPTTTTQEPTTTTQEPTTTTQEPTTTTQEPTTTTQEPTTTTQEPTTTTQEPTTTTQEPTTTTQEPTTTTQEPTTTTQEPTTSTTTPNPTTTSTTTQEPTTVPTQSPTTSTPEFTTPCPGGNEPETPDCPVCICDGSKFKHPYECEWYYECEGHLPVLRHCEGGFHWNEKYQVCDYPCLAGCEDGNPNSTSPEPPVTDPATPRPTEPPTPRPTTAEPPTTPEPLECPIATPPKCPYPDPAYSVFFPHPSSCRWFYHCSNGVAYCKICPANLHWNPILDTCDWPDHAGCSLDGHDNNAETLLPAAPCAEVAPFEAPTCPKPVTALNMLQPHPGAPDHFYICDTQGNAICKKCYQGMIYDKTLKVCEPLSDLKKDSWLLKLLSYGF
ncbi:mucin-2-like [Periplaneta americana]|uniref:mucin-2-like n=1 Tax=Periplaneta americana TaxID=6978 RepID=UPI0037E74F1D